MNIIRPQWDDWEDLEKIKTESKRKNSEEKRDAPKGIKGFVKNSWETFKKILVYHLVLIVLLGPVGCGGEIGKVKSEPLGLDKSITVGKAFDNYQYFSDTEWEVVTTENGRKLIRVTAQVDLDKLPIEEMAQKATESAMGAIASGSGNTFADLANMMRAGSIANESPAEIRKRILKALDKVEIIVDFVPNVAESYTPKYIQMKLTGTKGKAETIKLDEEKLDSLMVSMMENEVAPVLVMLLDAQG